MVRATSGHMILMSPDGGQEVDNSYWPAHNVAVPAKTVGAVLSIEVAEASLVVAIVIR